MFDALLAGCSRTVSSFTIIIESLKMLTSGAASVKDLGGPIMIAQLANWNGIIIDTDGDSYFSRYKSFV